MRTALIVCLLAVCFALPAAAQQITLVYPRADSGQVYTYPAKLDSTFVFGRVEPPQGELLINGIPVPVTARGAFLAWLPLCKDSLNRVWRLSLRRGTRELTSHSFPYTLLTDGAMSSAPDSLAAIHYPRVLRVIAHNAHARTAIAGGYFLFPDSGCALLASGHESGFFRVELGAGLQGVIEDRFVKLTPDTALSLAMVGRGVCGHDIWNSWCALALPRAVAWIPELSADGQSLIVTLYGVCSAIDRIRYDITDSFLRDIVWEQQANAVRLEFRCTAPIRQGYEIAWANDSVRVRIHTPESKRERGLKSKTIVVDPGHGGNSLGAIGPLGTLEKDVTLRLALILKAELELRGARVRLTREGDTDLDLYARVAVARQANPDFFLSLHANALPDSENPFIRHGSGTYYYQSASRPAAEILHRRVLAATKLRDDGLYDANLAVLRPTAFPAVLIETAYLMNPVEEELLQSDAFLHSLARGLASGLGEYFQSEP